MQGESTKRPRSLSPQARLTYNINTMNIDTLVVECQHIGTLDPRTVKVPPSANTRIYKDECTLCFASYDDEDGIDVCLACFQGSCPQEHLSLHFAKHSEHSIVLNCRRSPNLEALRKARNVTKLEIKPLSDEESYIFHYSLKCLVCLKGADVSNKDDESKLPELLKKSIDSVKKSLGSKKQTDVTAWQDEIIACDHVKNLVQETKTNQTIPLEHCSSCELRENLWLCLTCGNIGCGRQQYGSSIGGNGHALSHNEATGHLVTVKLGTITPEGTADIFCYKCGEERLDPLLVDHLQTFGIKLESQEKTVKSLAELQLEENLKFDFSMATEDGKSLKSVFGPGLTGIVNLGNSCYLSSVLQSIFAIPFLQETYFKKLDNHVKECIDSPEECFFCQMHKVAAGLLNGKYSYPLKDHLEEDKEKVEECVSSTQRGIIPSMFKNLIGKGHQEFSTMKQQDAQEYFQFLCSEIERRSAPYGNDPTSIFKFVVEEKITCESCKKVKYTDLENLTISLPVITEIIKNDDPKVLEYKPANLIDSLREYFKEPGSTREQTCSAEKEKKNFNYSLKLRSFPDVMVFTMNRFVIGENWVMEKLNAAINAPSELDLNEYYSTGGPKPNEEELPQDEESNEGTSFNQEDLNQLLIMGFPEIRCKRALIKTHNSGSEAAMNWLFEHMEDPDIDAPLSNEQLNSGSHKSAASSKFKEDDIAQLADMGFTFDIARRGLKETGGNVAAAVEWLFNNPDADGLSADSIVENVGASNKDKLLAKINNKTSGKYKLFAFISHKGTSAHCGHYVAHVNHPKEGWVLFNDNKVVKVPQIESAVKDAYIYLYQQI